MSAAIVIKISSIRPEGIDVSGQLSAEYIGLTKNDPLFFISPLDVKLKVERVDDTILAKVNVRGEFQSFCYRTLAEVKREWTENFTLDFFVSDYAEEIELDESIREEVILRIPMRVLSDEELAKEAPKSNNEDLESEDTYQPFAGLKDIEQ